MKSNQAVRIAIVTALALLGTSEWRLVFGWGPIARSVVIAAIAPAAISVLFSRPAKRGVGPVILLSLVALAWYLAASVLHDSVATVFPSTTAPTAIGRGLINGWSEILSLPLPTPVAPQLLITPLVIEWVAVMAAAEFVQRIPRSIAALGPPLLAFAAALFFGIGASGNRLLPALGFVGGSMVYVAITSVMSNGTANEAHRGNQYRRLAEAGIAAVGVLVLAATIGPVLPVIHSDHPYNPRTNRVPPSTSSQAITPLDELSAWASEPNRPLFTVYSPRPVTTQLAVLATYSPLDGWTDTSRFENIGSTVPPGASFVGFLAPETSTVTATENPVLVHQRYQLGNVLGPWLPSAGVASRVTGVQALASVQTGVLLAASGSARGANYTVTSKVPEGSPNCVGDDVVASRVGPASTGIAEEAENLAGSDAPPCAEAQAMLRALSAGSFRFEAKAPSGSNIEIIQNFLFGKGSGAKRGTSEQFAAAYALMAQALGMTSRVVVGFHAGEEVSPGIWHVGTKDAFAWAEIDFAGIGWVGVDPTPISGKSAPADEPLKGKTTITPGNAPPVTVPQRYGTARPGHSRSRGRNRDALLLALGLLIGVVAIAFAAAGLLVARARRLGARRRRSADPRHQILGAWFESREALGGIGVAVADSDTPEETTIAGTGRLGPEVSEDLRRLATLVNEALFREEFDDDRERSGAAWRYADEIRSACDESMTRRGRLARSIDLRVLARHE